MPHYRLERAGSPSGICLFSSAKLSADHDFDRIVEALAESGTQPLRARKIGFVSARQATQRELIETCYEGVETRNTAEPGDWIVTNMDSGRKILRDSEDRINAYIVRANDFARLYERDTGETDHGGIYRARGTVDALFLPGGFDIVAPWGERQQGARGYLLRNGADVYGIHADAFERTYIVI